LQVTQSNKYNKHTSRKTLKQRNGDTKCSIHRNIKQETVQKYEAEEERGTRDEYV
jgi:hypothetical protein